MFIDGKNIANILVDPSQQIEETARGKEKFYEALEKDSEELETDAQWFSADVFSHCHEVTDPAGRRVLGKQR